MFKNRKKPLSEILNNFEQHLVTLGYELRYDIENERYIKNIRLWRQPLETTDSDDCQFECAINVNAPYYYDRQSVLSFKEDITRLTQSLEILFNSMDTLNVLIDITCNAYDMTLHFEPSIYVTLPYALNGCGKPSQDAIEFKAPVPIGSSSGQSMHIKYVPSKFRSTVEIVNEYGYAPYLVFCIETELPSNTYNGTKINKFTWERILSTVDELESVATETYLQNQEGGCD